MSRPREFDQAKAIETAMNEIWENGYEACSVKALSEKLGITRSSFYNAFQSRADLFEKVLECYFGQSPDRVLFQVDRDTRIVPLLTQMFKEVCRTRASDPQGKGCMAINCVAELVGVHETLGPMLEQAVLCSFERFEHLLQRAAANGEIKDHGDLREKALALQNLLIGLNVMCKVVRSEKDLWDAARQTLKGLGLYSA